MTSQAVRFISSFIFVSALFLSRNTSGNAKPNQPIQPDLSEPQAEQAVSNNSRLGKSNPKPGDPGKGASNLITTPYDWHTFFGSNADDYGGSIAVAADGSVYITGQSNKSWLGTGSAKPLHPYSGDYDLVIIKLDKYGAYQWHSFYGSSGYDSGNGVAVAEDGSVYLTGTSSGNWLGDGGEQPLNPYRGGGDLVVVKLDSQGAYQWHTYYGSSDFDAGVGIAVASDGSIYVTEQSYASWQVEDETEPLNGYGEGNNLVVLKLDSHGVYQWHTFYGSDSLDFAEGIALEGDGNVYLTGYSDASWLGDGGAQPLHPHSGDLDLVVVKLDSQGVYQWHTFYGSSNADYGESIAIAKDGNIYITGQSYQDWLGDADEEPLHPYSGGVDLAVLKMDSTGTYQWHTFYGSSDDDDGFGIAIGKDGGIHITGRSYQSWLGDDDAEPVHPFSGGTDLFVQKLDGRGAYQWHTFYGSKDYDTGSGIAIASDGSVFVTGYSYLSWLGDRGEKPKHPHSGGSDLMLMKIQERNWFYLPMVYHHGNLSGDY